MKSWQAAINGLPLHGVHRLLVVCKQYDDHDALACSFSHQPYQKEVGCLCFGLFCLWHVQIHFVAVEVGVVRLAHALVEAEGAPRSGLHLLRDGVGGDGGRIGKLNKPCDT